VVDEAQFSKFVREEIDAGTRGAEQLGSISCDTLVSTI
jgi:hypothetical protein